MFQSLHTTYSKPILWDMWQMYLRTSRTLARLFHSFRRSLKLHTLLISILQSLPLLRLYSRVQRTTGLHLEQSLSVHVQNQSKAQVSTSPQMLTL